MHTLSFSSIALSLLSLYGTAVSALPIASSSSQQPPYPPPQNSTGGGYPQPQSASARTVINQDFPDPSFLKGSDGAYYAFATSANNHNIQVARSASFSNPSWQVLNTDALPDAGAWTYKSGQTGNIWAPNVMQTTSGTFVMYYSAPPSQDNTKHCVGTATSNSITGPYKPASTPFACNLSIGGAIDPSVFRDPASGKTYVSYKVDGNSLGVANQPTPIRLQQISASDGVSKIGSETTIFDQDPSGSDGPLVEAPTLMYNNGVYFLLFSTNMYNTAAYDIRYVTASAITGPFDKTQNVLLKTNDGNGVTAPGSCDVKDGMIVFHGTVNYNPLVRDMYAGYLTASGKTLRFSGSV